MFLKGKKSLLTLTKPFCKSQKFLDTGSNMWNKQACHSQWVVYYNLPHFLNVTHKKIIIFFSSTFICGVHFCLKTTVPDAHPPSHQTFQEDNQVQKILLH